jgi:twitching motility protein PilT
MNDTTLQVQEPVFLSNFPFTDLVVRLDAEGVPSRFRPDITRIPPRYYRSGNFEVPLKYEGHMSEIRAMINALGTDEGTITFQGMRLRFETTVSEDESWAALRGAPLDVPPIDTLGLNPDFVKIMKSLGKKKGLIIVGGSTGDGKTTTCVSLLKHYLDVHGGLLYTLEDPPEWALHGTVNEKAFCLQYRIDSNEDWAIGTKKAMRSRPDYILFGEIRTPEAAESLLKTLTSGHLVVATIHAGQVSDTIAALMQLAEHKLGLVARASLADRLLAAVHQTMTADGPSIKCVAPGNSAMKEVDRQQIVETIKKGEYDNLAKGVEVYAAEKALRRSA